MPIGKPKFDNRPGVTAAMTARLCIVGMICMIQYWLLTSAVEAVHAGNTRIALPAFLASVMCFLFAAGLVITGEASTRRTREEPKKP